MLSGERGAPSGSRRAGPRPIWRPIWRPLVAALAFFALLAVPLESAAQVDGKTPLEFLAPLIGVWVPAPQWLEDNPGMEELVPIDFRWGPNRRSIIEASGLPLGYELFTSGLITWDPHAERAVFLASQGRDGLLFRGYYEALAGGGVRRIYDVLRPDGSAARFRETFIFDGPDAIDWLTEWEQDGRWVPRRGTGDPECRAIRRGAAR